MGDKFVDIAAALVSMGYEHREGLLTDTDEITIRVARYDPILWQCIIKRRDRTLSWSSATGETPVDAFHEALGLAKYHEARRPPAPRVRKRTR